MKTFWFDSLGRLFRARQFVEGGEDWEEQIGIYHPVKGHLAEIQYPSGLHLDYFYNPQGELKRVANHATGLAYWTLEGRSAAGQLTQSLAGNGVRTQRSYTPQGFVASIVSTKPGSVAGSGDIQDNSYKWDNLGNLIRRRVDVTRGGYQEDFSYDELNRLTGNRIWSWDGLGAGAAPPEKPTQSYSYDGFGNMAVKSDKGAYAYDFGDKPHAVREVELTGGVHTEYFQYDAVGNLTKSVLNDPSFTDDSVVRKITWTGFNQPLSVKRGTSLALEFVYDGDQSRINQVNDQQLLLDKYYYADAFGGNRSEQNHGSVEGPDHGRQRSGREVCG
ncbi:RHS repeat domain-containing protein [Lacibacterium aquatile]|uniref:RHS repeat domain-containing protein n=1 Tax=Lacibacterium aquatile TaxID=1168082 RepID=A0ABW5DQX1_9PROT